MVSSSQDFSGGLPNLAQANNRYVCNQNEQQTTALCISSPRSKCNGSRCIEYLVVDTRLLFLMSNSSHTKNDSKDENLCLPNDCSSPRVARDELVWGSNRTFCKNLHYNLHIRKLFSNNLSVRDSIKISNISIFIWIRDQITSDRGN